MTDRNKHNIELRHFLSTNPSKNYILNLLSYHIEALAPERSLDAGVGELRNLWMFPGKYVGISHRRLTYFNGLKREPNPNIIRQRGLPEVYLIMLESDFSFLGDFDLCVSTFTIDYVEDRLDAIKRLSDRVALGGSFILQAKLIDVEPIFDALRPNYDYFDITYSGLLESNQHLPVTETQKFADLVAKEINAPNTPEGHTSFYLFASGKRTPPAPSGPRPEIIEDNGLFIVKKDIPRLRLND